MEIGAGRFVAGPGSPLNALQDLAGISKRRNPLGVAVARRLDARKPRGGEGIEERDLLPGWNEPFLVLKPITGKAFADPHLFRHSRYAPSVASDRSDASMNCCHYQRFDDWSGRFPKVLRQSVRGPELKA